MNDSLIVLGISPDTVAASVIISRRIHDKFTRPLKLEWIRIYNMITVW